MTEAIPIHNDHDFQGMRVAGRIAAQILDDLVDFIKIGTTTGAIDAFCREKIAEYECKSATIGYKGYKWACCTSVNHVVCHGIPNDDKVLQNGDIVNVDVTIIKDGYYGDTSRMYPIGDKVSIKAKKLVQVTYDSMMKGIEVVRPGVLLSEVGKAIQNYAQSHGFSVVRDFCGHGIGKVFHAQPNVTHYYEPAIKVELKEGMFFTIEPMINAGGFQTKVLSDGWTAVTKDRSLSAQFEHTIAVTKEGYEIFTLSPKGLHFPPYS
jgi:methionyl aminopeptidase